MDRYSRLGSLPVISSIGIPSECRYYSGRDGCLSKSLKSKWWIGCERPIVGNRIHITRVEMKQPGNQHIAFHEAAFWVTGFESPAKSGYLCISQFFLRYPTAPGVIIPPEKNPRFRGWCRRSITLRNPTIIESFWLSWRELLVYTGQKAYPFNYFR